MRSIILRILYVIRLPHFIHFLNQRKGRIPIILFHDVNAKNNSYTGALTPDEFENIILFLKQKYELVGLDKKTHSRRSCIITFDDGMLTFLKFAYPILKKHQVPAILFIPPAAVDEGGLWTLNYFQYLENKGLGTQNITQDSYEEMVEEAEKINADDNYRLMTWDELGLLDRDLVSIQSHTNNHKFLSTCDKQELINELKTGKERLENKMGIAVNMVAYPFGDHNATVLANAQSFYSTGFIVGDQLAHSSGLFDRLDNPRFHIHSGSIHDLYARISGLIPLIKKYF